MQNYTVVFSTTSGDITISAREQSNLLDLAQQANVAIDAPCGGNGTCGKCRVRVLKGSTGGHCDTEVSCLTPEEETLGWRLACKSTVIGDVTVELPDSTSAWQHGLKVNDEVNETDSVWRDLIRRLKDAGLWSKSTGEVAVLEIMPPDADDNTPDSERLRQAVAESFGVDELSVQLPFALLQQLPEFIREENFSLRVLLRRDMQDQHHRLTCDQTNNQTNDQSQDQTRDQSQDQSQDQTVSQSLTLHIVALTTAESTETPCALVCDLGTTSVSLMLVDLIEGRALAQAASGNAQIRYGADVINRIMQQAKPGGVNRLRHAIVEQTLNPLIAAVCDKAGVSYTCVSHMVVAGNTVMSHLLLGVRANHLRMEPYVPCFGAVQDLKAGDFGAALSPFTPVYLAPNVGSYVGGDITAGVLASGLWHYEEIQLFVDLGTNGELVFGNNEFMMCCACSAGPAFEGGGIRCGMRATEGAIEKVSIDRETHEPTLGVIGKGKPSGMCGSGLIDVISELFRVNAIDGRGRFIASGKRFLCDEHDRKSYIVAFAEETTDGEAVTLDEVDIENFIRAKGAIFSAICVMLDATGFAPSDISRVLVAGGIGSGIDIEHAITIGLFPDIAPERYTYLGNTSLLGARAMAQSVSAREKVAQLAAGMTYLELSSEPGYMDAFVAACFLPHTNTSLFPSVTRQE